jgi:thiol-disulfide isomerase/thioredoxin
MRTSNCLCATLWVTLICAFTVSGQEPAQRRAPQLTTEDVIRQKGTPRTIVVDSGTGKPAEGRTGTPVTTSWLSGAEGYAQAVQEQAQTGAPMAVYFYTDWCPYCKRLEQNILSAGEVDGYLNSVIKVKINPEDGSDEESIGRRFGITGYPSFFMVSSNSRPAKIAPFKRQGGGWVPMEPSDFVAACRQAAR